MEKIIKEKYEKLNWKRRQTIDAEIEKESMKQEREKTHSWSVVIPFGQEDTARREVIEIGKKTSFSGKAMEINTDDYEKA